jgi:nucleoside-triphosphatase THEP1
MRISVICGARDSGKTRAADTLASRLRAQGIRVGGVLSEAELSDGEKVRYIFRDLATGGRELYARRRQGVIPREELGYEFLTEGVAFGCAAVRRAAADRVDVLFIDEIGPLEAGGGGLWEPLREVIPNFPGRLVITVRPALLDWLLQKSGMNRSEAIVLLPADVETALTPGAQGDS